MKPAAIGIIYNEDRTHVLLVERRDVPLLVLPGGGIDAEETPAQAVVREVWEETGLRVDVVRQIAEYSPINKLSSQTYVFECQPKDGILRTGCETASLSYYSLNNLPKNTFVVHRAWLNDALLNVSEIIRKDISQVTYLEVFKYFCKHPTQVVKYLLKNSPMGP